MVSTRYIGPRILLVFAVMVATAAFFAIAARPADAGVNWWCYAGDRYNQIQLLSYEDCDSGTYYTINGARAILYRDDNHFEYGTDVNHCVEIVGYTGFACTTNSWRDVYTAVQHRAYARMYQTGSYGHWFHGRAAYGGDTL